MQSIRKIPHSPKLRLTRRNRNPLRRPSTGQYKSCALYRLRNLLDMAPSHVHRLDAGIPTQGTGKPHPIWPLYGRTRLAPKVNEIGRGTGYLWVIVKTPSQPVGGSSNK